MSTIPLDTYKEHLRVVGTAEDTTIQLYANAAEQRVEQHLNRAIFADREALDAAILAVPDALDALYAAYDAAIAASLEIESYPLRCAARDRAVDVRNKGLTAVEETYAGMVINDAVSAACLLWAGTLYANRESAVGTDTASSLPFGIYHLLQPYRVGLGV